MSTGSYRGVPLRNRRRDRHAAAAANRPTHAGKAARPPHRSSAIEPLESRVLLTAVLPAIADAYLRNNAYVGTNFGGAVNLYAQNASSGDTRVALVKFDVSSVDTITSAVVRAVVAKEYPQDGTVHLNLYPVADTSWVEGDGTSSTFNGNGSDSDNIPAGEVTWNNSPMIGTTPIASATINRYGLQTYSWDVTNYLIQQKSAGAGVVSFAFNTTENTADWTRILSRESGPYGPQLVVNGTGASQPIATVNAPDVTDPSLNATAVSVTYGSEQPLDPSTVNAGNITVNGPAGPLTVLDGSVSQNGSGNGTSMTAVYDVAAPSGGWNAAADNGLYTVTVQPGKVKDFAGGAAPAAEGQFRVAVGDATAPTATISSAPALTAASPTYQFTIAYADDQAIDTSFVDVDNVQVHNAANATLPILSASVDNATNGTPRTVTYTVGGLNGSWTTADNGTYTIVYGGGVQVRDTAGNPAAPVSGTFQVNISGPHTDTTPPGGAISAPPVSAAGGASESITVVYTDDTAVKASTIDTADLTVTGPAGPLTVTAVSITPTQDSGQITAVYTVAAPGGQWTSAADGTYTIALNAGQVTDTSGNAATAPPGTFVVNVPAPDTTPPTATISAADVNAPGGTTEAISITFSDNVAVDVSTINAGDISVSGPAGPLQVVGVQVPAVGNGSPITATYIVAAPGGSWQPGDNGVYTISLAAGSVKDTSGNGVVAATGTFTVNATSADTTPPNASQISAPPITTTGAAAETITIVFTDDVAVSAASISPSNLTVTGPGGPLTVTAAQANGGNGSPLVASYTVAAPGGAWSSANNGSYIIALNPNQVADTSGNFANGVSGSFTVNIPAAIGTGPNDSTFNNGQALATGFITEALVTQPDGKILAVGRQGDVSAGTAQGVIERFNPDGTADNSFGGQGKIVSRPGINEAYYAVVLQDANHFIVAGTSGGDFVLVRYDLRGNLDPTFGTGGRVTTDFGTSTDEARGLGIAPGGLILAAGDSGGNFAFARYDANGHLDPNFAQNGRQLFGLGAGNNGLGTMIVQPDGKVIAVGSEGGSVVVVRLTAAGEADGTFGNGGLTIVNGLAARQDLGGPDRSEGLALQSNGDILVANRTPSGHFGLARLTPTGAADAAFGAGGIVTASFGGDDDADSIVLQDSGPIIVIGTSSKAGSLDTAVAAFDSAGNPMGSFGSNGLLTMASGVAPTSHALHVGDIVLRSFGTRTSDGRVIIGSSDEAVAATTSSTLRRLIVPGADVGAANGQGTLLGTFGIVNGKRKKLTFTDADGTRITLTLLGGTGQAYLSGDRVTLVIDDLGGGVTLTITGRGGDNRISLADVTISGTLRAMTAKNADLFGVLHVTGAIGRLAIGNISGSVWSGGAIAGIQAGDLSGNVYATGALGRLQLHNVAGTIASGGGVIGTLIAAAMDNARILSGANLGADGAVGGSGPDADTYGAGAIGSIVVKGTITSSFIGAGVDPVDSTFGNSNDRVVGGPASTVHSIVAKRADAASRFEAGAFGKARLPKTINVLQDPRFRVL